MDIGAQTRALVTGASRGIGRALAQALAARGATAGLLARDADELEALASRLPGRHVVLPTDVGSRVEVERAAQRFIEVAGGLELVIANAGVADYGPFAEQSLDAIERMTQVNWLGTVYTISATLPHLLDRAHGHIVVISSGAALRTFPWASAYGATKAAQRGFAEGLRHELSGTGVGLTVVYPGEIATDLHAHELDRLPDWNRASTAAPPGPLAEKVLEAVERDRRALYHPPAVRLLGIAHGINPKLADRLLRAVRGGTAAPRAD